MSKKIIIVGNGISATEKKKGKLIDTFDQVYRFYPYKIDGFEDYIGKKTTHVILKLKHEKRIKKDISKNINIDNNIISYCQQNNIEIYNNKTFKYINNTPEFYKNKFNFNTKPRAGLKLIFLLLEDYECVYLYGFDIFGPDAKKNEKYGNGINHYWTHTQYIKTSHDPKLESEIILYLKDAGKVKFI
jgi:hypothetical protein